MNYLPFLMMVLTINLIPGASVVFVSSETINGGLLVGILVAISLAFGDFILVNVIGLGFSSVLQHHPEIIQWIKYAGIAYLCYMGVAQLMKQEPVAVDGYSQPARAYTIKVFGYGILYEMLNPKLLIFFMVLLPLFVNFNVGHVFFQFVLLGIIFSSCSLMVNSGYAWIFHQLNSKIFANTQFKKYAQKVAGVVMLIIATAIFIFD